MRIALTGGAGYVGSHAAAALAAAGHDLSIIDNLDQGHAQAVAGLPLIKTDLTDRAAVFAVLASARFDAVMHFAASALVGESVRFPGKYFRNNLCAGLELLDAMVEHEVSNIVFSSTAAVYGEPDSVPIREDHVFRPTNPYGASKMAFESALTWYGHAHGVRSVRLRYFNAAGATSGLGEDHDPETHLVPLVLGAALETRDAVEIYGTDYPTADGTCVRDYIHVVDLAQAHVLALQGLDEKSCLYNLGNGQGFTVQEVVAAAREVTGRPVTTEIAPRRPGDPATLVASSDRISGYPQ